MRQYKTGLAAPNDFREYGSTRTISVPERIARVHPTGKVALYHDDIDLTYTYAFPGAGALTLTATDGGAVAELNAGLSFNGTVVSARACGFDYTRADINGVAYAGPFSVAMQSSFLCNDTAVGDSFGGGSIFGKMQAG